MAEDEAFRRRPLHLEMRSTRREDACIAFPPLPAPWHAVAGFARAKGLSRTERYRALALCTRLFLSGFKLDGDLSVADWLRNAKQPERLIELIWEPLCIAAMNTPLDRASAKIFIRVLREAFAGRRSDADMLFPRVDLGGIFPDPAIRFVREHGGTVHFSERVASLEVRDDRIEGVTTNRGDRLLADHVVIAASPGEALRLVEPHPSLKDIGRQLTMLRYEPVCTIYLQYPPQTTLGGEMLGLLDGTAQWIFDLGAAGHPGRMAVVISGPGPHMDQDNAALIATVSREIGEYFPGWPRPSHTIVIREKRAGFSCHVGVDAHRPGVQTPVRGCWLAGDYTATGFPATLEGALRSGVSAARKILGESAVRKAVQTPSN